jgi:hypothetical protein
MLFAGKTVKQATKGNLLPFCTYNNSLCSQTFSNGTDIATARFSVSISSFLYKSSFYRCDIWPNLVTMLLQIKKQSYVQQLKPLPRTAYDMAVQGNNPICC